MVGGCASLGSGVLGRGRRGFQKEASHAANPPSRGRASATLPELVVSRNCIWCGCELWHQCVFVLNGLFGLESALTPAPPASHTAVHSFALVWLVLWNMQAQSRPLLSHPWPFSDCEGDFSAIQYSFNMSPVPALSWVWLWRPNDKTGSLLSRI